MEALHSIHNPKKTALSFSAQYLLDCDDTNYGCDGGWMTDAYYWTIDNGIVLWDDYKNSYRARKMKCDQPKGKTKFFNKGANEVENTTNEFLKARLAKQPVGAAYYSNMKCMSSYKSGTMMASDCGADDANPEIREVNHAVTIVGYGKSERKACSEYWLIKNSWGTKWGENGHFKICADRKGATELYGMGQINSFIMWPSM